MFQYPKFKSPYTGDFSILGTSPCADAGNNTLFQDSWTIFDIRTTNSPRKISKTDYPQAGTIDIGCFEYNSNTDLLCQTEAWVSSAYSSSTPNWRETYFNDLDDAVNVTCDDATVNITNYSHIGDVEMGDRTFVVGDQDFDMTGDLSGAGLVQVTNAGKLIMNNLAANTTKSFPITDGTYNYTMTVNTADNSAPDISVRINNLNPTGSINSDFWDIEGPTNLNATITLRVDKASIAPKTLGSSTSLRYHNGTKYVPVNGNNFSIEEFDTYYIITLTGINKGACSLVVETSFLTSLRNDDRHLERSERPEEILKRVQNDNRMVDATREHAPLLLHVLHCFFYCFENRYDI